MSNALITAAKSVQVSTPTAKFVLVLLADSANEKGLAWPSLATLSEWSGFALRSVRRCLRQLENEGLIRPQKSRPGMPTVYLLTISEHCTTPDTGPAQPRTQCPPGHTVPRTHSPPPPDTGSPTPDSHDQNPGHRVPLSYRTLKNPNRTIGREEVNSGNSNHENSSEPLGEPLGDALSDRIAKCNPAWRRAWSYEEQSSIALNRQFWISLGDDDWELLTAWFRIREREGEQLYRVQKLCRFLADPGSELDKARAMRDRDRKRLEAAMAPKRKKPQRPAEEPEDEPIDPVPPEEAKAAIEALRRGIMKGGGA